MLCTNNNAINSGILIMGYTFLFDKKEMSVCMVKLITI